MRLVVIGGSGYLGSELLHLSRHIGHDSIGTYCSSPKDGLVRFDVLDKGSWNEILRQKPEVVIWAAHKYQGSRNLFAEFINKLQDAKLVYVSSDVVLCRQLLNVSGGLADYAKRKIEEQNIVLQKPNSLVCIVGPIYGTTSDGVMDGRSEKLLTLNQPQAYWTNVYKTFVPVNGLARTVLHNMEKSGVYFVGPDERQSYYDFYRSRAKALGMPLELICKTVASQEFLEKQGICQDTAFANEKNRLWT